MLWNSLRNISRKKTVEIKICTTEKKVEDARYTSFGSELVSLFVPVFTCSSSREKNRGNVPGKLSVPEKF